MESCPFVFAACGVFSMAWKPIRRHLVHRPIVKFIHERAARRTPYLPHGSVKPHLVQRTCHPGALSSGFILSSPNNDYTAFIRRETKTVPFYIRSSRYLLNARQRYDNISGHQVKHEPLSLPVNRKIELLEGFGILPEKHRHRTARECS